MTAPPLDESAFETLAQRHRRELHVHCYRMLALAKGLLAASRLLLLDKPPLGLAPQLVDQVFEVIADVRTNRTRVLLVEQDTGRALAGADCAYVMESGVTTLTGSSREPSLPLRGPDGTSARRSPSAGRSQAPGHRQHFPLPPERPWDRRA